MIEQPEWIISAKKTLNWFIKSMGQEVWEKRRGNVVKYFNNLRDKELLFYKGDSKHIDKPFYPYAIYDDWIAWYMYLIESLVDRPACDEPMQSGRIYPFFAAIGRRIELAQSIDGVDVRITELLNERQNQPDSSLFELLVAITYRRNGWEVRFIPESPLNKTPDFVAQRGGMKLYVECKRFSKVTGYSERERQEWVKRWQYLCAGMQGFGESMFADVIFKVPVEETGTSAVVDLFIEYVKKGWLGTGKVLETDAINFSARLIDMEKVNAHFSKFDVRHPSPQFISLLADGYSPHGNYTTAFSPSNIAVCGEDDGLHVLNLFIGGFHSAYCGKWKCVAEKSIFKKAKDVRTTLSDGVSQIPDGALGVIHIGYETYEGPEVEFKRHERILNTIQSFDVGNKHILAVFCHAFQSLANIESFECAETTNYFGRGIHPSQILAENLLLDAPGIEIFNTTHWLQDAQNQI